MWLAKLFALLGCASAAAALADDSASSFGSWDDDEPELSAVCQMRAAEANASAALCSEACLQRCWRKPWSPCLRDCKPCALQRSMVVAAILPYAGRFLVDYILVWLLQCLTHRHRAVIIVGVVVAAGLLSGYWAAVYEEEKW